jgi:hypothetical protein
MKINFTRWTKTYHTPHFGFIVNEDYYQLSFIVWNFHWWIIINKNKQP